MDSTCISVAILAQASSHLAQAILAQEGLVGKKPTVYARRRLILKHEYCLYTALQEMRFPGACNGNPTLD